MFFLSLTCERSASILIPAGQPFLIGRGPICNMTVRDPSASRVHCRLIASDDRLTIYDAGSRWGTFVNRQRIAERRLNAGDIIQIGMTSIDVQSTPV